MLTKKEVETRERYLHTLKTSHEELSLQLTTMLAIDEQIRLKLNRKAEA